eukprot:1184970-Prorocentrum_minimum.AAC.1
MSPLENIHSMSPLENIHSPGVSRNVSEGVRNVSEGVRNVSGMFLKVSGMFLKVSGMFRGHRMSVSSPNFGERAQRGRRIGFVLDDHLRRCHNRSVPAIKCPVVKKTRSSPEDDGVTLGSLFQLVQQDRERLLVSDQQLRRCVSGAFYCPFGALWGAVNRFKRCGRSNSLLASYGDSAALAGVASKRQPSRRSRLMQYSPK